VVRVAICWVLVTACSSKPAPPPVEQVVPHDAGEDAPEITAEPIDPASEVPIGRAPGRAQPRAVRPIDVILRSSPSGATVAVDGVLVGTTPTYWSVDANGREHEFLFVRKGYAYARYRFVPISSGVVHARLEPIGEDSAAGMPADMIQPPAAPPPRPPRRPTPLAPADAALPSLDADVDDAAAGAAPLDPVEASTTAPPP
jgi:hypothetical protein